MLINRDGCCLDLINVIWLVIISDVGNDPMYHRVTEFPEEHGRKFPGISRATEAVTMTGLSQHHCGSGPWTMLQYPG